MKTNIEPVSLDGSPTQPVLFKTRKGKIWEIGQDVACLQYELKFTKGEAESLLIYGQDAGQILAIVQNSWELYSKAKSRVAYLVGVLKNKSKANKPAALDAVEQKESGGTGCASIPSQEDFASGFTDMSKETSGLKEAMDTKPKTVKPVAVQTANTPTADTSKPLPCSAAPLPTEKQSELWNDEDSDTSVPAIEPGGDFGEEDDDEAMVANSTPAIEPTATSQLADEVEVAAIPAPALEAATKPVGPPPGSTLRELIVWNIQDKPGVHDIQSLMVVCERPDYNAVTRALTKLVQQKIIYNINGKFWMVEAAISTPVNQPVAVQKPAVIVKVAVTPPPAREAIRELAPAPDSSFFAAAREAHKTRGNEPVIVIRGKIDPDAEFVDIGEFPWLPDDIDFFDFIGLPGLPDLRTEEQRRLDNFMCDAA